MIGLIFLKDCFWILISCVFEATLVTVVEGTDSAFQELMFRWGKDSA